MTAYLTEKGRCIESTKKQKQLSRERINEWLLAYPALYEDVRSAALEKIGKQEKKTVREVWLTIGAPEYCRKTVMSSIGDLPIDSTLDQIKTAVESENPVGEKRLALIGMLERFYDDAAEKKLCANPFDEMYEVRKKEAKFTSAAKRALVRNHLLQDEIERLSIVRAVRRYVLEKQYKHR